MRHCTVDCTCELIALGKVARQTVEARFGAGDTSSNADVLLLRPAEERVAQMRCGCRVPRASSRKPRRYGLFMLLTYRLRDLCCGWAHARRKFYELHQARPSTVTAEALRRIGQLYAIEARIRGKPPDERCRIRQAESRPQLDALQAWLRSTMETLSRKSDTTATILYALNRWQALARYCDDGTIEIDNSAAERALRGVALGRKNYLFVGADSGGERAAALYSLIETAKLNGLDPEAYLRQVLACIADYPINRIDELLLWNMTPPTTLQEAA